jgi:hypothetical protein
VGIGIGNNFLNWNPIAQEIKKKRTRIFSMIASSRKLMDSKEKANRVKRNSLQNGGNLCQLFI